MLTHIQSVLKAKPRLLNLVNYIFHISNTLKDDVEKALDFIADISNVMKIATPDEKNTLLKNLLTNCILDGDVLKYEIKAPFDKLLSCSNYKKWKDIALDNINDFENCIQK